MMVPCTLRQPACDANMASWDARSLSTASQTKTWSLLRPIVGRTSGIACLVELPVHLHCANGSRWRAQPQQPGKSGFSTCEDTI